VGGIEEIGTSTSYGANVGQRWQKDNGWQQASHFLLATFALHQHRSVNSGTLIVGLNDCLSDHLHRKSDTADVAH